ncbi:MAG: acetyl-CoA carboxylase biotin carboxyl carrier protein subunit [Bacteroidales bacterium]|nr:acetyl-CoA carboxylase biotin carboxyl carrier protein subunit [Bacteroidales bacterium]
MEIQIGNRLAEVTLLSKEGNKVSIEIDGKVYNVDICMFPNGQVSILNNGISYDATLIKGDTDKHYRVGLNYSNYEIDMLDSQAKYMRMRKKQNSEKQDDKVKSPMPCKIVKIYVQPGQELQAGDIVLTIEAMKMQSNITVSEACTVAEIKCAENDSVMADQVLVTLNINK